MLTSSSWIFVCRTEPTTAWRPLPNFSQRWDIGGYSSRTYYLLWFQGNGIFAFVSFLDSDSTGALVNDAKVHQGSHEAAWVGH